MARAIITIEVRSPVKEFRHSAVLFFLQRDGTEIYFFASQTENVCKEFFKAVKIPQPLFSTTIKEDEEKKNKLKYC